MQLASERERARESEKGLDGGNRSRAQMNRKGKMGDMELTDAHVSGVGQWLDYLSDINDADLSPLDLSLVNTTQPRFEQFSTFLVVVQALCLVCAGQLWTT